MMAKFPHSANPIFLTTKQSLFYFSASRPNFLEKSGQSVSQPQPERGCRSWSPSHWRISIKVRPLFCSPCFSFLIPCPQLRLKPFEWGKYVARRQIVRDHKYSQRASGSGNSLKYWKCCTERERERKKKFYFPPRSIRLIYSRSVA